MAKKNSVDTDNIVIGTKAGASMTHCINAETDNISIKIAIAKYCF